MIELFDAALLERKRDRFGIAALVLLAMGAGGLAVYAASLQQQLREVQSHQQRAQATLRQAQAIALPTTAILQDLQAQTHALQQHIARYGAAEEPATLAASHWLDRIAAIGNAQVSLARIEIDRRGSARVEGMATHPQAVSAFVQAWAAHDQLAGVPARSLEVRQDKGAAPQLRFVMQAHVPATPRTGPAAAADPKAAPITHVESKAATPPTASTTVAKGAT